VAAHNQGCDASDAEAGPCAQIHPFVEFHVRVSAQLAKAEFQFLSLTNQQILPRLECWHDAC
jgi:hypothetical protein